MYDDDEGGTIDFTNLKKVANELEDEEFVTDEEIEMMLRIADTSGKGVVDKTDFRRIMREAGLYQ